MFVLSVGASHSEPAETASRVPLFGGEDRYAAWYPSPVSMRKPFSLTA